MKMIRGIYNWWEADIEAIDEEIKKEKLMEKFEWGILQYEYIKSRPKYSDVRDNYENRIWTVAIVMNEVLEVRK